MLVALALSPTVATSASALPAPPQILTLSELQQKLTQAGDPIDAYFKTVDRGSTVETIPCTIDAITSGPLIVFDASGPEITKFGGIAAGMSGSPLYIDDGGVQKLVGAVSYGNYFTLGGTGLATPIEQMIDLESSYSPAFQTVSAPIITSSGVIDRVIVVPDPQDYAGPASHGALVAKPLAEYFIGGLSPGTKAYKAIAKSLAEKGISVVSLATPLDSTPVGADPDFETTLTSGAAIAALTTRGDMWVGDLGSVTYAAGNDVLAFGHPMMGSGDTSYYMLNAWIDSVWPSIYQPYKMGEPTKLRGTITEDRNAGILGQLDQFAADTTITAHAVDDKGHTADSTVFTPRSLIDTGAVGPSIVAGAVSTAGFELFDSSNMAGSADVTTTVVVGDGTDTYTVSIPNVVDDAAEVPYAAAYDAANAIGELQGDLGDGVTQIDIRSIDLQAKFSSKRRFGSVVGVQFDGGLHVGANRAHIFARIYGSPTTQTVDATLTVPEGTPLAGTFSAVGVGDLAAGSSSDAGSDGSGTTASLSDKTVLAATTSGSAVGGSMPVSQIVGGLNNTPSNNSVLLTFTPLDTDDDPSAPTPASVTTTVTMPWVMYGTAKAATPLIQLDSPSSVGYRDGLDITGEIDGPSTPATVSVYATPVGGSEALVGTTQAIAEDGALLFDFPVDSLTRNTTFRVHFDGQSPYTGGDASVFVGVRASVSLSATSRSVRSGRSITLKADVSPSSAIGGKVVFEFNDRARHWKAIGTKTLTASGGRGGASLGWKPPKGKHPVRVRYLGGTYNVASTSSSLSISAK